MKKELITIVVLILAVWGIFSYIQITKQPSGKLVATVNYACNEGKSINAAYYEGESKPAPSPDKPPVPGGSAKIMLSDGRKMVLPQTISADGIRYANEDDTFVFWSKGNGALVLENNEQKSYIGCIAVAPDTKGVDLPAVYANSEGGFTLRLPSLSFSTSTDAADKYKLDEAYHYQGFGPGKDIAGVKFTIPAKLAEGTNLSEDSYISVEELPRAQNCTADLFLDEASTLARDVTDGGTTYSFVQGGGAAAGNRYEETVYALPGTKPCVAVRYLIHYGVFENYEPGMVKEFDKQAILAEFDNIRRTLVVNQ